MTSKPDQVSLHAPLQDTSNAAFPWAAFDSEAYFQHYYGTPHRDDERVIASAVRAFAALQSPADGLDCLDVGTGPNLIPLLAALPRARRLTAWEFSESNVAWLNAELARPQLRPQWQHFWRVVRASYDAPAAVSNPDVTAAHPPIATPPPNACADPLPDLRRRTRIVQGSIFDLPRGRWDAATMFFCAESMTACHDEFERAVAAFAGAAKPGGLLAAAFLVRSGGYEVSGRRFPVLPVSIDDVTGVLARYADSVTAEPIGIVPEQIRSGYAGFVFVTAMAR